MKQDKKDKKEKKKNRHIGRKLITGFLIIALLIISGGAGIVIAVIKSAPDINTDIISNLKQSGKIYDKDGNYIEDLSDAENRQVVPLSQIPEYLQHAFIAIEDERFEQHHGIDVKRIFGALWYDLRTMSKGQGASTITQQLIKLYALSPEKKLTRKIQEAYLALQLERKLSKDQILHAYLNTIYLGGNAYGVQAASLYYFGKDVQDLDIAQSALIAGLTQNPAKFWPYSKKNKENPEAYITRQRLVLSQMLKHNYITQAEYDKAYNEKLEFKTKDAEQSTKYQWFIEPAVDQVAKDFSEKYGITEAEAKQKLRTGGYQIYLTIDTKIQDKAESVINDPKYYPKLPTKNQYYATSSKDNKLIQPQSAAVVMDAATGEVRAIVGGRGPHPLRSYNRATDPEVARQPGSAIKPLAVYGPAIDEKIVTAASTIEDSPLPQDFVDANNGWDPQNFDSKFRGYTTIRNAIKDSVNLVAIKLLKTLGISNSIDYLQNKFHISTVVTKGKVSDENLPALALGGMTYGVTPLEMTAAYAVFSNNGVYSEPIMYTKVLDSNGSPVLEKTSNQSKAISPQAAYIMSSMLQTVVKSGTGTKARLGNMPVGGKTGTSDDHTNGWFMGITPYYSGAVWMGSDDKNYHVPGLVGGTEAPMWRDIMTVAHQGLAVKQFQRPSGIVEAQACLDSGKAPTELCAQDPRGSRVQTELFIDGTQPVELCDIHTTANIDIRNGKLATENTPPEFIQQRVFIKRPITSKVPLLDDPYILPTQFSDLSSVPQDNGGTDNNGTSNGGTIDNGSSNDNNVEDDNVNVDNNAANTSTNTGTSTQKPPKEQPKKP